MPETVPSDNHRNKNPGATPTLDSRAHHKNCIKEKVLKIFPRKHRRNFSVNFFDKLVAYWNNALSKLPEVISGR